MYWIIAELNFPALSLTSSYLASQLASIILQAQLLTTQE